MQASADFPCIYCLPNVRSVGEKGYECPRGSRGIFTEDFRQVIDLLMN